MRTLVDGLSMLDVTYIHLAMGRCNCRSATARKSFEAACPAFSRA